MENMIPFCLQSRFEEITISVIYIMHFFFFWNKKSDGFPSVKQFKSLH